MTIFGLSQVVREPVSKEQRLATSVTRRVGACPRCHKHRLRCDMPGNSYEPCARCATQLANFYLRNEGNFQCQPAIRINLLDLQLHRKGPTINDDLSNWVQGKQILQRYQKHHDIHHLFLTQTHAEGLENALCVPVSRFDPQPGDRTAYNWTDLSGNLRSMEVPPFYISDLREASQGIRQFVHSVRSIYIEALLADSNPLIRQTFQAALTYATFNQTGLVTEALETWVSARLIETQWHVYAGGVEIGLEPKDEPGHPWHNITPVTPIMDSQLDDIVIRDLLVPHTHFFLRRLKAKIDEQKRENWLEIYFAMFIMMSNVGWILKDMAANAAWKGLKPGSRGGRLTQGYIHACKSMLAYFHFTCAGSLPLSVIMDEDSNLPGITPEQIEYLQCAREEMARQGEKLSKWKDLSMYDDDGYWCYQMLCRDWKGDVPHAGDIDDFTEEDFLSSST
ncbi:hypothetical protein M426DRAFT_77483 [Hypoxylon sp. CI-4A]|nr:hypothetical protein M426DRAFT_77483 [Hypoxylon sp. CI-4A]